MTFPAWLPTVKVRLDLRDIWVGLFWKRSATGGQLQIFVCIIPCFPIILTWGSTFRTCEICTTRPRFQRDACVMPDHGKYARRYVCRQCRVSAMIQES